MGKQQWQLIFRECNFGKRSFWLCELSLPWKTYYPSWVQKNTSNPNLEQWRQSETQILWRFHQWLCWVGEHFTKGKFFVVDSRLHIQTISEEQQQENRRKQSPKCKKLHLTLLQVITFLNNTQQSKEEMRLKESSKERRWRSLVENVMSPLKILGLWFPDSFLRRLSLKGKMKGWRRKLKISRSNFLLLLNKLTFPIFFVATRLHCIFTINWSYSLIQLSKERTSVFLSEYINRFSLKWSRIKIHWVNFGFVLLF